MILIMSSCIILNNLGITEMVTFITLSYGSRGFFQISMMHTFELHLKI